MERLVHKLKILSGKIYRNEPVKIALLGLGSVGSYLLDYLLSCDENIQLIIAGRNEDNLDKNINISVIANGIKYNSYKKIDRAIIDLNDVNQISEFMNKYKTDFIVNTSRAFSGLKYGSISWNNLRAYGIWSPLSVKFIKNIMSAYRNIKSDAVVINTSYSDVVNPWLKSAGFEYPDFGSGNLNHLIPRIKLAAAKSCNLENVNEIDVTIATSHFHDVVISKEGHDEGVNPLISILYNGNKIEFDPQKILKDCAIPMPSDSKRNQMNAASNFEIIYKIIKAIKNKSIEKIHSPGAVGNIGGYPLNIDFTNNGGSKISFNEEHFTFSQMAECNRRSIYLDGIENIENGILTYTDDLLAKVESKFNMTLPKDVHINESDNVSEIIIDKIIKPNLRN